VGVCRSSPEQPEMNDTDDIIPNACRSWEEWQRAEHKDLGELDPAMAWSELLLLRRQLAAIVWRRTRRLRIVRASITGEHIDERQWAIERIALLERRLGRGRAA